MSDLVVNQNKVNDGVTVCGGGVVSEKDGVHDKNHLGFNDPKSPTVKVTMKNRVHTGKGTINIAPASNKSSKKTSEFQQPFARIGGLSHLRIYHK